MKIRMLTFHNAHNYGALLQCYSLCNELSKYGECRIIDYNSKNNDYRLIRRYKGFKNRLHAILRYKSLKKRFQQMNEFIKQFQCTEPYNTDNISSHSFAACICVVGSDQVWSCNPTNFDKVYFLNGIKAKKKVSYAASMGHSEIPVELRDQVGEALSEFSAISVREKSAAELLRSIYDLPVTTVLDPVFLQTKDFWNLEGRPMKVPSKYILVYFLEIPVGARDVLKKIKKRLQLPVLAITTINTGLKYGADRDLISVGPREFLWLFEHAEFVVTSSFHGTAFSIVFEKQFYTLPKRDTAERMVDLLDSLGLQNRIVRSSADVDQDDIDYSSVNVRLEQLRKESKEFIRSTLMDES